jgi:FKBP-type peptidyl-prolyl cis-trans isomerase (trigger factor)
MYKCFSFDPHFENIDFSCLLGKRTVSQQFETNFEVIELYGKTVSYDLEIIEVSELVLPQLTDDMLQTLGVKSQEELYEKS